MIITIIVLAVTSYLLVFGAFYISDDGLKFYLPPMVAALAVPTLTLGSFNVITDEKTSGTAQLGILAAAFPLSIALVLPRCGQPCSRAIASTPSAVPQPKKGSPPSPPSPTGPQRNGQS